MNGDSLAQLVQHSTGFDKAQAQTAMNAIFPPQYYSYGADVIDQFDDTNIASEINALVNKFASKPAKPRKSSHERGGSKGKVAAQLEKEQTIRLQKEMVDKKRDIDAINKEVENNIKRIQQDFKREMAELE